MKPIILFLLMTTTSLFSSNLSKLYKLYEKQEYLKACDYAHKYYNKNKKSEKFLTLYGLSCLETDKISRIATPMMALGDSKDSRANSSYFSTILLQKQLLRQALLDNKKIDDLHLPTTNFIVSKIFNMYVAKEYEFKENIYIFQDKKSQEKSYKLYMDKSKKRRIYMIIDIYKDEKFIKRYRYN
jgi:hypothetical protein